MGITKKILFGVLAILLIALLSGVVLNNSSFSSSSDRLVGAIVKALQEDSARSLEVMDESFADISARLSRADEATGEIILKLYRSSYDAVLKGLGNQILPMIEGFDFEQAGASVENLLASARAVRWDLLTRRSSG